MSDNTREATVMITTGARGVGKTYQNIYLIERYVKDKPATKVRGRKVLIYDTNGEYTQESFQRAGVKDLTIKTIAVKDIKKFVQSPTIEARRVDAKLLTVQEKVEVLKYILQNFSVGMLVLEDMNNYLLQTNSVQEIVGKLTTARHVALDILISLQSLAKLDPTLFQNAGWIRMHHQLDNVDRYKTRIPSFDVIKIAQLLVDKKYDDGDERYFLYVSSFFNKLKGNFTKEDYREACIAYLATTKNADIKQEMQISGKSMEQAREVVLTRLMKYYGNE
jgi:hypothetical protein